MIIFQRIATFRGPVREVTPWAMEVTELVRSRTEFDPSLWQGVAGGPVGTLVWSSIVPNLTELEHGMDVLAGDQDFLELIDRAGEWIAAPPEDHILRMVHSAGGEYVRPDVGAYAEGYAAVPAEGKLAKATAFGVDIADLHSDLTHASVLFCTDEYGPFGSLRWMALYPDAAAVDTAAERIAKDDDYTARLDASGDLFLPGSGTRALARRIA